MKLKRVIGVVGLVAVYCGPGLFFILAVALGVNIGVALFITLGTVIVIRFVLNIDFQHSLGQIESHTPHGAAVYQFLVAVRRAKEAESRPA